MQTAPDRLELLPPPDPGLWRSLGLALLAHAVLLVGLSLGMSWKREAVITTAAAELWSALPQEAAPPPEAAAPPEPVAPAPKPVQAKPAPEPEQPMADIALKKQKLDEKKRKLEALKQDKLVAKQRADKALEKELDKKKVAQEKARKLADEKKRQDLEAKKEAQAAKALEAQRQDNIKRALGLAAATGSATSSGTALKSSGPSASYGGKIVARIKPNIVFTEELNSNPAAEIEVRTLPDGTIIGRKLVKTSGIKAWDEAVLKAIDKTESLPRDIDGSVPSSLTISFKPKD
jgi:colicin import membrane protein